MIASVDWMSRAACRDGAGLAAFFGPDDERPIDRMTREAQAKAVCDGCPVTGPCLTRAVTTGDKWSVAGAMTPDERANYKRRNRSRPAEMENAA